MKKRIVSTAILSIATALSVSAQDASVTIHANKGTNKIYKEIYGYLCASFHAG